MIGRSRRLALVCAVLGAVVSNAVAADTGFLNRSATVDGAHYRYQVYVPREFDRSRAWPVILALHGGGQYGHDGFLQTEDGLGRAIREHADRFPAVVVFPQSPPGGTPGFQGLGERIALAELDAAMREFNGDPLRVYLTGLSMGGNGAWSLAYRHPDRFAALVVVCGFIGAFTGTTSGVRYPPLVEEPAADPYAAIAQRVKGVAIRIFHGTSDPIVPVEVSRNMAAALRAVGADVTYTEFAGVGHNAWDRAYGDAELFTWLFARTRTPSR